MYYPKAISYKLKTAPRGVTLLEIILVTGILAVLGAMGIASYRNYVKQAQRTATAKQIIFALKDARTRAVGGDDVYKWGIHFVNGASDYYEIFETPTDYSSGSKVIKETVYLPDTVIFTDPASSSTKDIIFNRIAGTITADTSVIISQENVTTTITVNTLGNVY